MTPKKNRVHTPPLCDSEMLTLRRQVLLAAAKLVAGSHRLGADADHDIRQCGSAKSGHCRQCGDIGVKFYSTQAGTIAGIRFYRGHTDPSGYAVELFSSTGTLLGSAKGKDTCSVRYRSDNIELPR